VSPLVPVYQCIFPLPTRFSSIKPRHFGDAL
jgi:hypothetical protein